MGHFFGGRVSRYFRHFMVMLLKNGSQPYISQPRSQGLFPSLEAGKGPGNEVVPGAGQKTPEIFVYASSNEK